MRVGASGHPFALDFASVMAVGAARGVDTELLASVMPEAETAILDAIIDDAEGRGDA